MSSSIAPPSPGYLDQIQFINFYLWSSCEAPGMLYIEYAKPIAHSMLLAYVDFDVHSFIKTVFRPRWKRGSGHGRRSKRGKKYWVGIPEVSDLIAERLDSKRTLQLPPTYATLNYLIFFDDIAEVASNQAWLIDSAIGLPYQTIMGLLTNRPELCQEVGRFARSDDGQLTLPPIFGWFNFPLTKFGYAFNCLSPTTIAMQTTGGEFAVMWQVDFQNYENQTVELDMRLWDPGTGEEFARLGRTSVAVGHSGSICISGHVPKNRNVQWQVRTYFDNLTFRAPKCGAIQIGH